MKDSFWNISRQLFVLFFCIIGVATMAFAQQKIVMPGEDGVKPPINYEYFPSRQHAFVWRNWSLVDKSRLAEILSTSVENVDRVAQSMGLPKKQRIEPEWATTR